MSSQVHPEEMLALRAIPYDLYLCQLLVLMGSADCDEKVVGSVVIRDLHGEILAICGT